MAKKPKRNDEIRMTNSDLRFQIRSEKSKAGLRTLSYSALIVPARAAVFR